MEERNEQAVDDRGTSEAGGREILRRLRDQGFEADDEKLAVALGRPVEEVQGWTAGGESDEPVDDDIIMKARGIAKERGIELE
ncbi:MAG TPA: hypothetical protein VK363_15800 [Pyrinomonadaceae bacterium]|nr:hypothetical protein [Pyrinomonadaceae bacterium]